MMSVVDEVLANLRTANEHIVGVARELCALETDRDYLRELVRDCYWQACCVPFDSDDPRYDHQCISVWEECQRRLLEWGMLKAEECARELPLDVEDAE
jgi:hypothetical protein